MKIFKTTALLLFSFMVFLSGCSFLVPEEYKDGVKIDRQYPEDDLPVYEDAIVFSSEEDDGEIILMMGTGDDLDDIIDFYQDFFEDEGITLSEEDEGKNDYYAEGHIPEYDFELTAEKPDGKWEEKLFTYVIEIVVTPAEDPVDATQMLLGSWSVSTMLLAGDDITDYGEYIIFTFSENGTGHVAYKWPNDYEYTDNFTWNLTDTQLSLKLEDDSETILTIDTITEESLTTKLMDTSEYDTIIYNKVPDDTWRPENITSPSSDPTISTEYIPQLDELYGAWVDYYGENSFALWADGTGRQWDYTYNFGWDITWEYDEGWLYIKYGDSSVDSYYVTYVGQDIYIENTELEIYQYMQRADSWITNTPWQLTYDSGYEMTETFFSYFYDDGTYTLYASDYTTVVASYNWSFTYENDIEMYDDTSSSLYHYSYEGSMLIMRTEDWSKYYEFTRAN